MYPINPTADRKVAAWKVSSSSSASRAFPPVAFFPGVRVIITDRVSVSPSNTASSVTYRVPPLQLKHISLSCQRIVLFKNLTSARWPRPTRPSILASNSSAMTRSSRSSSASLPSAMKSSPWHPHVPAGSLWWNARVPSVRSEYSHVVPLPPLRSHSSAIQCLQQQEARYAARTMLPVTRCSKADDHPQHLQGWRSCAHIVPGVSCDFSCHEPALDTTVLQVVNEPATNHLGARTQCCSRDHEQRILRTQRAELSFSALCRHSLVELFVGLLAVHKRPRHQLVRTRGCARSPKHFQAVQLLRHFWRHNVSVCLVFARCTSQVRQRFRGLVEDVIRGFQHAYLEAHYRLCPFDLGRTRIFSIHLDISPADSRQHFSSPQFWWHRLAEFQTHCCLRDAQVLSASPTPLALISSLCGHPVAHLLQLASYGSVAAGFLRSLHSTQRCVCRFRSSHAGNPSCDHARWPEPQSRTSAFVWPLVPAPCLRVPRQHWRSGLLACPIAGQLVILQVLPPSKSSVWDWMDLPRACQHTLVSIWLIRAVVWLSRTCAPHARRRTSALPCFLFFPTRPAPANSLRTCHAAALVQVPEPKRFRRNRQVRLGSCFVHDTCKKTQQQCRIIQLIRGLALSMAPMIAWLLTGEQAIRKASRTKK